MVWIQSPPFPLHPLLHSCSPVLQFLVASWVWTTTAMSFVPQINPPSFQHCSYLVWLCCWEQLPSSFQEAPAPCSRLPALLPSFPPFLHLTHSQQGFPPTHNYFGVGKIPQLLRRVIAGAANIDNRNSTPLLLCPIVNRQAQSRQISLLCCQPAPRIIPSCYSDSYESCPQ